MLKKPAHTLGIGVNYRGEISKDLIENITHLDFLEVNTEILFNDIPKDLSDLVNKLPVVFHGLTLSLGTNSKTIDSSYLNNLKNTILKIDCQWFSEHIGVTSVHDIAIRSLMPAEFTTTCAKNIANKVKKIMSFTNKPFLLENITYYYSMPNNEFSELTFINKVVEDADCGILLDLTNLYVNSINHGYDPYNFIDKLSLDRVVEVHLAGCDYIHGMLVDTHASRIKNEIIKLLKYLHKKIKIIGIIIERDDKLRNFQELIDEVKLVKAIMAKGR